MQPNSRESGYLWDMLQAARRLQEFTAGLSYEAYLESILLQSAVERQLEILGEAARRMSDDFRQAHPEIPWSDIIGQRNVIAHQYEEIRQERIWSVVTSDIPTLITQLEPLIPPLPPEIE
ncbi:HepT-like ribonuclease domain-containing protein [Coleofasciculus sp. E2-BRE-01]|uniref:HepT-like ribonuclease domain-containing protein n=1 Tax=Coleofasciculus sp. E2-BRE-01 TaxID=3069524 RepID=UPI003301AB9E